MLMRSSSLEAACAEFALPELGGEGNLALGGGGLPLQRQL